MVNVKIPPPPKKKICDQSQKKIPMGRIPILKKKIRFQSKKKKKEWVK